MATDLHDIIAPALTRGLTNLAALLHKGEAFAADGRVTTDDLLGARLVDDMHPLVNQVQLASDSAKGAMARLAGVPIPAMPDTEASFADLQARIARTLDFVASIPADAVNGKEASEIVLTFPQGEMRFTASDYVRGFVLPNFYFHLTTAYALLRAQGVPIGKRDFLGG